MRPSLGCFLALCEVQIIALLGAAMADVVTGDAPTVTVTTTVNRVPNLCPCDRIAEPPSTDNESPTAGQSRSVTNFSIVT